MSGDEAAARDLIQRGADVKYQDEEGSTPLYIAARCRRDAVVGTPAPARQEHADDDGFTPLSIAAGTGTTRSARCSAPAPTRSTRSMAATLR